MSEQNKNAWSFGEDTSSEGLDFGAIFGSGGASDVNPFDALVAQAAEPAASPIPAQTAETPAQARQSGTVTETAAKAEQPSAKAKTPKVPAAVQGSAPTAPAAEGGDLISAAIAKQEKAEEQAKVKSIFEKAPVFSYGSAKEDITDPAQTFEELRIAKSDDFPELSEGKRVSWSVEYGKVTKAITDPKGTTIRSVKEEIEKSKAFLDGLKKAKDKNLCAVSWEPCVLCGRPPGRVRYGPVHDLPCAFPNLGRFAVLPEADG